MDAKHWSVPIRPAIAALRDSLIRRISEEGMGRDGVIALWFGEPDAPTPQFIKDAATAALAADHTFYTQTGACRRCGRRCRCTPAPCTSGRSPRTG